MLDAVLVWSLVELLGLLALPAAGFLFARLPGRGLALARPLGLLLAAYPVWLLASLDIVPYGRASAAGGVALVAALAGLAWIGAGRPLPRGTALRLWLAAEAVFTVAFFGWTLLRSFAPDVWNTEKPMDMAFINAVNRSESFPPHDPWLSGETLNYYYFGHYLVAFLIRLAGVDPATGFNLGVALFYALTASVVVAVAATLTAARSRCAGSLLAPGLAGVAFAMVLGNLAGAVELLGDPRPLQDYDWWSPSRVIDGTANEFPFFSFLLGDLHAHVMATPYALVALAFALQLALAGPRLVAGWRLLAPAAAELLLAALVLGSLYAVNTLDFATAAALLVGGLALWLTRDGAGIRTASNAAWLVVLLAAAVAFFLPFIRNYSPEAEGIALVAEHDPFTRFIADIALIYALPLWVIAAALVHRLAVPIKYVAWGAVLLLVVLVLLAPSRVAGLFLVLTVAAVALHGAFDRQLVQAERFFWLLVGAGLGLVAVGDFVYIRDVFEGTESYRFNTVFKTGYQAWFLLAIAAGCGVFWYASRLRRPLLRAWQVGLAAVVALLAVYPVAASYAVTSGFSDQPTLDGTRWLTESRPGDSAAIRWLRSHVDGTPTILEAVGEDFSPAGHGRVSTFTGLPTVLGWRGHEVQWGHEPGDRGRHVRTIYSTRDIARARALLDRYGVRYVFVGALEREAYSRPALAKFVRLGTPVYSRLGTTVYRIDPSDAR